MGATDDDDVQRVERWFSQQGVPRFVDSYRFDESVPLATAVLAIVLAFELTARPEGERPWAWWADDASWGLWGLLSPLIILALLMPALPLLRRPLRAVGSESQPLPRAEILWLLGFLAVEGFLLSLTTMPPAYSSPWVEFAIAAFALVAFVVVLQDEPWRGTSKSGRILLGVVTAVLVPACLLFAIDLSQAEPRTERLAVDVGSAVGIDRLSVAAPSCFIALLALGASLLIRRMTRRSNGVACPRVMRSVPSLILLFACITALMPKLPPYGIADATIAVTLLAVALAAPAVSDGVANRGSTWRKRRDTMADDVRRALRGINTLLLIAILFLVVYPVAVAIDEPDQAGKALAMNLSYFVLALLIVSFGIDRVIAWGFGEARRSAMSSMVALSQGVPLLLIVVLFFGVTAEIWQLAHRMQAEDFVLLPAFLLAITLVFLVLRSWQELKQHCRFRNWEQLKRAALRGSPAPDSGIQGLVSWVEDNAKPEGVVRVKLGFLRRLNALLVLLGYQAFLLIPVFVLSFFIFLALGHLAVDEHLLSDWGVRADAGETPFDAPPVFHPLWFKVSLLLASFSVLSLSVQATATKEQRNSFFKGPQALRQRLAVRYLYETSLPHATAPAVDEDVVAGSPRDDDDAHLAPAPAT